MSSTLQRKYGPKIPQQVAFGFVRPSKSGLFFRSMLVVGEGDFDYTFAFTTRSRSGVMRYPVDVLSHVRGYIVSCRDFPEAQGQGDTREAALSSCLASLIDTFEVFFAGREAIPEPSAIEDDFIVVPSSVAAKVLLLNEVVAQNVSNTDLAKRLGLPRQEITRIFNLSHATKIDTIQKALAVLGRRLELLAN